MTLIIIAATVLGAISSFLLQPLLGKALLPAFGGTAAVWIVCMMFFQGILFLGYLYSHLLVSRLSQRAQLFSHAAVIALSFLQWPFALLTQEHSLPAASILFTLAASVFLPCFALSTTSPLLQAWAHRSGAVAQRKIYSLYAVSNIACFAALVAYPLLMEPALDVTRQRLVLSGAYAVYSVAVLAIIASVLRRRSMPVVSVAVLHTATEQSSNVVAGRPRAYGFFWWIGCSFGGNFLLLSVTNNLCLDIAPMPLLWTAPLSVFLASYVFTFTDKRIASLPWLRFFAVSLLLFFLSNLHPSLLNQIGSHLFLLLCGCMICHGSLHQKRPPHAQLTLFYFAIACGGLLAGIVSALVIPNLFNWFGELYLALAICVLIDIYRMTIRGGVGWTLIVIPLAALVLNSPKPPVAQGRNFFGVMRVIDEQSRGKTIRSLVHGSIRHGGQVLGQQGPGQATSYYCAESLAGRTLPSLPSKASVALIGLGSGTLALYGRPGDHYTFFEINPLVIDYAGRYFSFLRDSHARISIVPGDARLALESFTDASFDAIVIDAFSGDAVPPHIITLEALKLYRRLLRPEGIILAHISNKYLDLRPLIAAGGKAIGWSYGFTVSKASEDGVCGDALWGVLQDGPIKLPLDPYELPANFQPWTDAFSSLLPLIARPR